MIHLLYLSTKDDERQKLTKQKNIKSLNCMKQNPDVGTIIYESPDRHLVVLLILPIFLVYLLFVAVFR